MHMSQHGCEGIGNTTSRPLSLPEEWSKVYVISETIHRLQDADRSTIPLFRSTSTSSQKVKHREPQICKQPGTRYMLERNTNSIYAPNDYDRISVDH